MVISRTPFRVSFFGGGTDYPKYYDEFGGEVLSTTIAHYNYITAWVAQNEAALSASSFPSERTKSKLPEPAQTVVRESLRYLNESRAIEVRYEGELPSCSGIGSSSAFTVGVLRSLHALQGKIVSKQTLTQDAIYVEQSLVGEPVGSQDQTSVAHGGFNRIRFEPTGEIEVQPVEMDLAVLERLQDNLMLFYSGYSRRSAQVAECIIQSIPSRKNQLHRMKAMVSEALGLLNSGNLDEFGELLKESWALKKSLSPTVSNPKIDEIFEAAQSAGALGGKLLGAGAGGFVLLYVPRHGQPTVRQKLHGLTQVGLRFEKTGSQVIFFEPDAQQEAFSVGDFSEQAPRESSRY